MCLSLVSVVLYVISMVVVKQAIHWFLRPPVTSRRVHLRLMINPVQSLDILMLYRQDRLPQVNQCPANACLPVYVLHDTTLPLSS